VGPRLRHRAAPSGLAHALSGQRALRTGSVTVRVSCDELCNVRASGRALIVRGRARAAAVPALRTRVVHAALAPNARVSLRLRLSRVARRSLRRALARPGRWATVRIAVVASDRAGNRRTKVVRVRVARR
jgi:hypothetical protein